MRIPALLLTLFFCSNLQAQSLKKYTIGSTTSTYYGYCDPGKWDYDKSEDSSDVWTSECVSADVHYGIIYVKLLTPLTKMDDAEELVISYLDYLKLSFGIKKAAGYGKGNLLNNDQNTRGVLDYWEDGDKNNWKIKAWTNGKAIGVFYGYSLKPLQETKLDVFLNGLRFN